MNFLSAIEPNIGTEFLTYQLKVALILVGFFLSYHLLMSRETFHKLNRFLLTSMLVASFVLPFCVFKIHRYVPEEVLAEMTARDKVAAPVVMPAIPILPPQLNNAVQSEIKATPSVSKPAPVAEKPVRSGFPKAVRPASASVVKEEPVAVPVEKEVKEKKPGLLSRVRKNKKENRTIQVKTTTEVRVVVIEPSSFDDSQKVADFLRNDQPVVVNFETTEPAVRKRMTDFISGTIYALNGTIRTIGPNILVCAPRNVDIDAEAEVYGGERGGSSWPKN